MAATMGTPEALRRTLFAFVDTHVSVAGAFPRGTLRL